jgi:iron complex outermembrane receptor protein
VPTVKGIAYLTYRVTDDLSVTPSIEFASDRWTSKPGNIYYETGAFALVNVQGEYSFTPETSLLLTARNLFDEDYTLTDGYPEAGRSFQATMRAKF